MDSFALGDGGGVNVVRRPGELVQVRGSLGILSGDVVRAFGHERGSLDRLFALSMVTQRA